MSNVRKITCKILEGIEEGTLTAQMVAEACLKYMSEDEVADMAHDNAFFESEEEEDNCDGGELDDCDDAEPDDCDDIDLEDYTYPKP